MSIQSLALALSLAASAAPAAGPLDLRLDAGWNAPVGEARREGEVVVVRGDDNGQAVILWPGLGIDAGRYRYLSIEHGGIASRQLLSLFVRSDHGEFAIEIPETGGAATVALGADVWRGTIAELGLVLGPAGNIPTLGPAPSFELRRMRLEPASSAAAWRERLTRALRVSDWTGSTINVLPENVFTVVGGLLAFAGVVLAIGRGGTPRRRWSAILVVAGLLVVELAMARTYGTQWREASEVAAARDAGSRPRELDWQLVEYAQGLRPMAAALGPDTRFEVQTSDPYVASRLRYHLLPYRVGAASATPVADPRACTIRIADVQPAGQVRAIASSETAFGPVFATVGMEDAACSSAASR